MQVSKLLATPGLQGVSGLRWVSNTKTWLDIVASLLLTCHVCLEGVIGWHIYVSTDLIPLSLFN